jgi:leucyl-tRNA synthetase
MRESFRYWYPLDFRTSGKDLIKNHLTMSLYNHAVIWEGEDMIPRGMFANGWIMVDGEKMAKSKGNVYTAVDLTQRFGADASRIAMGSAGDSMGDANLLMKEVDEAILKLSALEMWLQENTKCFKNFREGTPDADNLKFFDDVFENQLKNTVHEYCNHFDKLVLREVLITSFFQLNHFREEYRLNCGNHGFRRDLIIKYVEIQLTVMYPIAPHFAEIMWQECFLPNLDEASRASYSEFISNTTLHEVLPNPLKKLGPSLRNR